MIKLPEQTEANAKKLSSIYKAVKSGHIDLLKNLSPEKKDLLQKHVDAIDTPEDFVRMLCTNDLPAVKLTSEEMEIMRGGWMCLAHMDFMTSGSKGRPYA
jgi:hypothetical protein